MTKLAKTVRDFWREMSFLVTLDPEVLQDTIDSLDDHERELITTHRRDSREFIMHKILNRHNDICNGYTMLEDGDVTVTTQSSITELDISLTTLLDCNKNAIYKIDDLGKEVLPQLQYASIREANEALQRYIEG